MSNNPQNLLEPSGLSDDCHMSERDEPPHGADRGLDLYKESSPERCESEARVMNFLGMRVRTLMIIVAIIGILLGMPIELARRYLRYSGIAAAHATIAGSLLRGGPRSELDARRARWHFTLFAKYSELAKTPWRIADPDSPEPR